MGNVSLIVGLLLACILVIQSVRTETAKSDRPVMAWVTMAVALVAVLVLHFLPTISPWQEPIEFFLAGFGIAIGLLDFPDSESSLSLGAPLGICLVILGAFAKEISESAGLALASLGGVGAAGALLALANRGNGVIAFSTAGLCGLSTIVLGSSVDPTESTNLFINILTIALISVLAGEILGIATKKSRIGWPKWASGIVFSGLALLVSNMTTSMPELPLFIAGAGLLAVVMCQVNKGIEDKTVAVLLGALIWLGVGMVSFNWLKGYGLSVVGLVAVVSALISGERRMLAVMSPMLALILLRLVKFVYPDAVSSLDIGQHYSVVGLILGCLMPVLLLSWGKNIASRRPFVAHFGVCLAGVSALLAVTVAVVVLGAKGATGLVLGSLLSPVFSARKGDPPKSALAVGIAFAMWTVVCIGMLVTEEQMARPDRMYLVGLLGGIAVLTGIAAALAASLKFEAKQS